MTKLEDYHWFCPEPWTNIVANPSGFYKPCCVTNVNKIKHLGWEGHNTKDYTYEEFWQSDFMVRLRSAMKNGGDDDFLNAVCVKCVDKERIGVESFREWYIHRFKDKESFADDLDELERIVATDEEPTFYHSMEFLAAGGNTCNLSCNMCNDAYSNTRAKESQKIGEFRGKNVTIKPTVKKYPDIQKVRELKLTGGEPFMIKENWKLIEDAPEGILLRVITNGTVTIRDYDVFKKFSKVWVNISIEGPKDVTEYIRYPSNFDIIEKNKAKFEALENTEVIYVTTINALNIHRVSEIYGRHESFDRSLYSIECIPDDIKEVYMDKLYSYGVDYNDNEKLIKYLENAQWDEFKMWRMLSDVKKRDQVRNTCLLDVVPEWKDYY